MVATRGQVRIELEVRRVREHAEGDGPVDHELALASVVTEWRADIDSVNAMYSAHTAENASSTGSLRENHHCSP